MTKVELIHFDGCPTAGKAREQLRRAFAEVGLEPAWQEWDRDDPASPAYVKGYGSPTILVDGRDVASAAEGGDAACCRVYMGEGGVQGVPPVEQIVDALKKAAPVSTPVDANHRNGGILPPESGGRDARPTLSGIPGQNRGGWISSLAAVPGIGVALLPALLCPACWPAYAGVLGSMGIGFLANNTYLLPITAVLFAIALAALAWRAHQRRGYGPLIMGTVGAASIIIGKFILVERFVFDWNPAVYGGIALFIAASLWNAWPKRAGVAASCPACVVTAEPQAAHGEAAMETGK
ncbi:MerC family mercury resistance protein [bacterium]|nr:MerC family mercury resistance protein [bacterium]